MRPVPPVALHAGAHNTQLWPRMAPPFVPGVGRISGGLHGFPTIDNPRTPRTPGVKAKTPRYHLTRCVSGNIITKASHPDVGTFTEFPSSEEAVGGPKTPKTRHDTLFLHSRMPLDT